VKLAKELGVPREEAEDVIGNVIMDGLRPEEAEAKLRRLAMKER